MDLSIRKILIIIGFLISVLSSVLVVLMELPPTEAVLYITSIIAAIIVILKAIESAIEKLLEELGNEVSNRID